MNVGSIITGFVRPTPDPVHHFNSTGLHCAPPTCVVHHGTQGGPMSLHVRYHLRPWWCTIRCQSSCLAPLPISIGQSAGRVWAQECVAVSITAHNPIWSNMVFHFSHHLYGFYGVWKLVYSLMLQLISGSYENNNWEQILKTFYFKPSYQSGWMKTATHSLSKSTVFYAQHNIHSGKKKLKPTRIPLRVGFTKEPTI